MPLEQLTLEYVVEEWRAIVGYEGWYSVSSLGRIRRDRSSPGYHAGHILKPTLHLAGYTQATLCRDKNRKQRSIHAIVAEAFLGLRPTGKEVNHRNGIKNDNRTVNLEWVTPAENMRHARHVLARRFSGPPHLKGEQHGAARFTEQDIREIRRLYATGKWSQRAIGQLYAARQTVISRIVRRERWGHVV